MDARGKKIIIADRYLTLLQGHADYLSRQDISMHTIKTNTEALLLQNKIKANLIVTGFDVPGLEAEELCNLLRSDDDLQHVSIIIVCSKKPGEADRYEKCRANAFLSMDTSPHIFANTLSRLLNIAERSSIRVPVCFRVDCNDRRGRPFMGYSENLSASGMLVETDAVLEMGTVLNCSFYLEDNTQIIASAEVVRLSKVILDSEPNQYGLQFTGLCTGVIEAIESYISKHKEA